MKFFFKNRTVGLLLILWAISITGAIALHWRIFRYMAIAILSVAILSLSLSILYGFLGKPEAASETKKDKSK